MHTHWERQLRIRLSVITCLQLTASVTSFALLWARLCCLHTFPTIYPICQSMRSVHTSHFSCVNVDDGKNWAWDGNCSRIQTESKHEKDWQTDRQRNLANSEIGKKDQDWDWHYSSAQYCCDWQGWTKGVVSKKSVCNMFLFVEKIGAKIYFSAYFIV